MPTCLTFDLEVQNHELNKRRAGPFDTRNYIVQIGWSINGGEKHQQYYTEKHRKHVMPEVLKTMGKGDILVTFNGKFDLLWVWQEPEVQAFFKRGGRVWCGQYTEYLLGGMVQEVQMASMNDVAEQYGGGLKIDAVKELWQSGVLTADVPRTLLTEYLVGSNPTKPASHPREEDDIVGDIDNTWLIFLGQITRIKAEMSGSFGTMLAQRHDALLASTEMEYNGMKVEREIGEELREKVATELQEAKAVLEGFIPELPPELEFNWNSNVHKSCLIFGGYVKYLKWEQHKDEDGKLLYSNKTVPHPIFIYKGVPRPVSPDRCKKAGALYVLEVPEGTDGAFTFHDRFFLKQAQFLSGKRQGEGKTKNVEEPDLTKPKGRKNEKMFKFAGYTKPSAKWESAASTDAAGEPLYSVGAEIVESLSKRGLPFTDALGTHTKLNKDLGTYYWAEDAKGVKKGMLTMLGSDGIIHHQLNHVNTVTSRMSSKNPNLQNIPRADTSEIKKVFGSRFPNGELAEIDYSQLEVVVQGVLTQDPQLCQDLRDKVDFHCMRLAEKRGEKYDHVWKMYHKTKDPQYKKWRTEAKVFSFQRAYGAGVTTIMEDTGMSKDDVQGLIASEERRWPRVKLFDTRLEALILANARPFGHLYHTGIRLPQDESHWDSPTGTRYVWREHIAPQFKIDRGQYTGFSPTERKNYCVQGLGGEIMQTMLGKVFRYMIANDRFGGEVLMTNTVHDCLLLDGVKDKLRVVAKEVQTILESVPDTFNALYPDINITVPFPAECEVGTDLYTMEKI